MINAMDVYTTGDAKLTRDFYSALSARGAIGLVAVELMRAMKARNGTRSYVNGRSRGGSFIREQEAAQRLAALLDRHGTKLGLAYGWQRGHKQTSHLIVDLPEGQVCFMSKKGQRDPAYRGSIKWTWKPGYVLAFCDRVMALPPCGQVREPAA